MIHFFSGYVIEDGVDHGSVETRLSRIRNRYLFKFPYWFATDLVSTIPFHLMYYGSAVSIVRLLRLTRLLRCIRIKAFLVSITNYFMVHPSVVRMGSLCVILLGALHIFACVYWMICGHYDFSTDFSDWKLSDGRIEDQNFGFQYACAFLWAVWVSTGTGFLGHPQHVIEAGWMITATLFGFMLHAFIIGSASRALADWDSDTKAKSAKLNKIANFLSQRGVPQSFIDNVTRYYDYCWARGFEHVRELFEGLHLTLQLTLNLAMNQHIILKVPMFRDITEPCLEKLISCLSSRIYLPGEWVAMTGEKGEEMFFVIRGKFEVLETEFSDPIATLKPGHSFGEMSLLMQKSRNSCVRSISHGELACLHQDSFAEILTTFPIFSISLQKWAPHIRLSRGWDKVRHAVRLCQELSKLGLHESFENMMKELCGKTKQTRRAQRQSEHSFASVPGSEHFIM